MALLWADGFDHYGTTPNGGRDAMLAGAWAQLDHGNAADPEVSTDVARTGTYSLKLVNNSLSTGVLIARRLLGGDKTTVGFGFGLYLASLPTVNDIHGVAIRDNTNTVIGWLLWQTDGSIALRIGATTIVTSAPVIGAASWNHVETKFVVDASSGACEVRVNGVTVINETNIDTGSVPAASISWGSRTTTGDDHFTWYIDDLTAWDTTGSYNNDFIGTARVETLFCDADTAQADWTVTGAADAHSALEIVPPVTDDTSYIMAAVVGDITELEFPALPGEAATIKAVFVPIMAKLEGAGSGNVQVSLVGASAGIDNGPDTVLTTAYTYWPNVFEENPDTLAPWTKAELEAALVRLEKTA